ncbi:hypothetical protein F4779DRAFT_614796 [Xylariaceae sp. FL0662B]|nr:hypothetical protein F4779DRAFT_614796 [Xylariaceae sp. FL0662B]
MYTQHILATILLATGAATTSARAIDRRQFLEKLGGIQCNAARFRIVGALGDTEDAVGQIQDTAVQDAASTGLQQAQDGIGQIAQAIIAGEEPPQEGRDQVEAGLGATGDALAGGDANDTAVADAQASLDDAVKAGQDVVANC